MLTLSFNRYSNIKIFILCLFFVVLIVLKNIYFPIEVKIVEISYYFQDIYKISENRINKTILINGEYIAEEKWKHLSNESIPTLYLGLEFDNSSLFEFKNYKIKLVSNHNPYIISHNMSYIRPENLKISRFGSSKKDGITALMNPEKYHEVELKDVKFYVEGEFLGIPLQLSKVVDCSEYTGNRQGDGSLVPLTATEQKQ